MDIAKFPDSLPARTQVPMRAQVLLLTDDADASRAWKHVLNRHDVEAVVTSYENLSSANLKMDSFHEIIVDHYDEPESALQICRQLRPMSPQPLLVFTYETDERFQIEAYRLGVEECIVKPIGIPLFVAKVLSWLRKVFRYRQNFAQEVATDHLHLDLESRMLRTPETSVRLSVLECRLMQAFMANRGQVLETSLLAERVWSMYSDPDPRALKNLIYRLRNKIERVSDGRQYIETISGSGYVLHDDA